jgi:MoaA/NifB/PqqE/SkfB family radical SAM enzyme|tara:strand:+ start:549 stop:1772 length:1224 start_codon:yes stop_codon:yes gene_type:complete
VVRVRIISVHYLNRRDDMADNFCIMPFVHSFVTPNIISPCCAYTGNIKLNSKEQYWNSDQLKNIQKNMLDNVRDTGCDICWKKEDRGFSSLRQHSNQIYKDHVGDIKQNKKLEHPFYIDLRLGNLCNLKCRMCISEWSSQIAGEILDNPNEDWIDTPTQKVIELDDDTWELLEKWLPHVRRVFMTGGEPTIIKRNIDYINKIVASGRGKDVELIFTTNATNINKQFTEIGKEFKSVSYNVSIDAVGTLARYIRYPSDWDTIENNLKNIKQGVSFNTTIQWLNMTRLNEIFDYIENCGIEFGGIWFQLVTDPHYLDPIYAPRFMKEKCITDIDDFLNRPFLNAEKYNNILYGELKQGLTQTKEFLTKNIDNTQHVDEFLKRMEILDRLRGQSLFDALPELRQLGGITW